MALQITLTVAAVITGQNDLMEPSQQLINANCSQLSEITLQAGNVVIQAPPVGFTVNGVWIKPPSNSTNSKILKQLVGDTGSAAFTSAMMMYPVVAGGSFVINSAGVETCELIWF